MLHYPDVDKSSEILSLLRNRNYCYANSDLMRTVYNTKFNQKFVALRNGGRCVKVPRDFSTETSQSSRFGVFLNGRSRGERIQLYLIDKLLNSLSSFGLATVLILVTCLLFLLPLVKSALEFAFPIYFQPVFVFAPFRQWCKKSVSSRGTERSCQIDNPSFCSSRWFRSRISNFHSELESENYYFIAMLSDVIFINYHDNNGQINVMFAVITSLSGTWLR